MGKNLVNLFLVPFLFLIAASSYGITATTPPVYQYTPGFAPSTVPSFTPIAGNYYTIGFMYTPTTNLQINALGVFDTPTYPLAGSRVVGIWNATTQQLLASVTVAPSSAIQYLGFSYALIDSITLTAGQSYMIAGTVQQGDIWPYGTFTGAIQGRESLISSTANQLSFPDTFLNIGGARSMVTAAAFDVVEAPEPATFLTLTSLLSITLLLKAQRARKTEKRANHS